jgi:hypothetical protein
MRTRSIMLCSLLLSLFLPIRAHAVGADLVFLGVLGNDAPAIEKAFDTRIREALSVNPEYHMLDYLASQDFRHRIGFDDFPTVSRRLVEGLRQFSSDSTVFVWLSVKRYSVRPVRTWVVGASARGELVLTLNMYSLRYKEYAFIGDVNSTVDKYEGLVFFYPLETGVHIPAADRVQLMEKLVTAAAFRASDLITSVVKSEKARATLLSDSGGMSKYKAASISDMFSVPSVEGASVDRSRKRPPPKPQVPTENVQQPASSTGAAASGGSSKASSGTAGSTAGAAKPGTPSVSDSGVQSGQSQ